MYAILQVPGGGLFGRLWYRLDSYLIVGERLVGRDEALPGHAIEPFHRARVGAAPPLQPLGLSSPSEAKYITSEASGKYAESEREGGGGAP